VGYLGLSKGTQLQKAKKLPSTLSKWAWTYESFTDLKLCWPS
jgi:hypothetical protein